MHADTKGQTVLDAAIRINVALLTRIMEGSRKMAVRHDSAFC
jgi:hypothetical protein